MNERIKELALEARIAYYSKNGAYEGSDEGLSVIPSTQSLEKFAELIVLECVDVASKYDEPKMSGPGLMIGHMIEQHFGIECEEDIDETCPRCGEPDSGTSCGIPDCGWITGVEE